MMPHDQVLDAIPAGGAVFTDAKLGRVMLHDRAIYRPLNDKWYYHGTVDDGELAKLYLFIARKYQGELGFERELVAEHVRHAKATDEAFAKLVLLVDALMLAVNPLVDRDSFNHAFDPAAVQGAMNAIEAHYRDIQANPLVIRKPRR